MRRRLTKLRLLSALRVLLRRPDTRIIKRKQQVCGKSTWEQVEVDNEQTVKGITIYLDPRRDGHVNLVIHELLHIYMALHFQFDERMTYELEEAAILAWESSTSSWLHDPNRAAELESWSRAIERKIAC